MQRLYIAHSVIPFWDIPKQDISWTAEKSDAAEMPTRLTQEKLISALIQMRKQSGMTQEQLAKLLGKPQSFVSKYETSERTLDFIEVINTIEAMGLDPMAEIKKLLNI